MKCISLDLLARELTNAIPQAIDNSIPAEFHFIASLLETLFSNNSRAILSLMLSIYSFKLIIVEGLSEGIMEE